MTVNGGGRPPFVTDKDIAGRFELLNLETLTSAGTQPVFDFQALVGSQFAMAGEFFLAAEPSTDRILRFNLAERQPWASWSLAGYNGPVDGIGVLFEEEPRFVRIVFDDDFNHRTCVREPEGRFLDCVPLAKSPAFARACQDVN